MDQADVIIFGNGMIGLALASTLDSSGFRQS
jgi:2-polyprenyl-6-methoxyphenol hydroxylase-like FAD-dependent oxidoreductase